MAHDCPPDADPIAPDLVPAANSFDPVPLPPRVDRKLPITVLLEGDGGLEHSQGWQLSMVASMVVLGIAMALIFSRRPPLSPRLAPWRIHRVRVRLIWRRLLRCLRS